MVDRWWGREPIFWAWNELLMPQLYFVGHFVRGCCDLLMGS